MIGLDTGILLGLLEQGDSARGRSTQAIVRKPEMAGKWFIHPLVLAEIALAMERACGFDRAKVADYLDYILHAPEFTVEKSAAAELALHEYRGGQASFADCLLGALNQAAGCETTITFAAQAANSAGFTRVAG